MRLGIPLTVIGIGTVAALCGCFGYRAFVIEPFLKTKATIRSEVEELRRVRAPVEPMLDNLRKRGFRVRKFQKGSTAPKDAFEPVGDYWFKSDEVWTAELYPPGLLIGTSGVSLFLVFGPDHRLRDYRIWALTTNFI